MRKLLPKISRDVIVIVLSVILSNMRTHYMPAGAAAESEGRTPAHLFPSFPLLTGTSDTLLSAIHESLDRKEHFAECAKKEGPKIFAAYLSWYRTGDEWTHWEGFGHLPQGVLAEDIASVRHPLTGLYDSSDRQLIAHHIELAQAAGIDGFIVDWYANKVQHDQNIKVILEEAEKRNFKIAVLYETRLAEKNPQIVKQHLRYVLENYAGSPAYQKVGGVPVIYLFGMVSTGLNLGDYAKVSKELVEEGKKEGKNFVFSFVGDSSQKPEYFNVANGLFEWINMGAFEYNPEWAANPARWEHHARVDAYRVAQNRRDIFVIGSVYSGFDDVQLGGGDWGKHKRRYLDDQNEAVGQMTADYAVEQGHNWVIVQTFNDWNEGTEFEPSVEKGFARIWHVLKLSSRMKGAAADPEKLIKLSEKFAKQNGAMDDSRKQVFELAWSQVPEIRDNLKKGVEEYHERNEGALAKKFKSR